MLYDAYYEELEHYEDQNKKLQGKQVFLEVSQVMKRHFHLQKKRKKKDSILRRV